MSEHDAGGLVFTAEMHGVQLDQLAAWLGVTEQRARAITARWREKGYAESARLGPGRPWIWLTRAGLAACGLPYRPAPPALSRLAHLRAVTAIRLALESTPAYTAGGAYWRSERRLRARIGGRVPLREHLPDGEVHWPDFGRDAQVEGVAAGPVSGTAGGPIGGLVAGPPSGGPAWAGECWAIEAELTRKTVRRTAEIMTEILTRTGDYGCPAGQVRVPGVAARHARVVYVCSPAARATVLRARTALGANAARVEARRLPAGSALDELPRSPAAPATQDPGRPA